MHAHIKSKMNNNQGGKGARCTTCGTEMLPCSVVLIITWSLLAEMFNPSDVHGVEKFNINLEAVEITAMVILYLLLPLVGLYADLKGRYWLLLGSTILAMLAASLFAMDTMVEGIDRILVFVMYPLYDFSHASITIVLLAFGCDQLSASGASSHHMSKYIWWIYWTFHVGALVSVLVGCSSKGLNGEFYIDCTHVLCLLAIFISSLISMRKRCMIIEPRTTNSLKLLMKVISYARKKRYPLSRRAVAQWEEDNPSRFDQGKLKYGGLFSEDEVEDVKSLLCMVPFLMCVLMIYFPVQTVGDFEIRSSQESIGQCLVFSSYTVLYVLVAIMVPILQCLPNRWTLRIRMLHRIALGIFLSLVAKAIFLGLDMITQTVDTNSTCIGDPGKLEQINNHTSIQTYFTMLVPEVIAGMGVMLVIATSFEFLFAQSPHGMRGLLVGIWFMIAKIMELLGWKITLVIQSLVKFYPGCQSYVLIMNLAVMCLSFAIFCIISKCYKLRKRSRPQTSVASQNPPNSACLANYGTLNLQ